jgi:2-succinyl-6-hydroxy-2,4-cyclohexadiene-1-carboxylate synthase
MRIRVNNISLNIIGDVRNTGNKLPVLFLHGFTGRADDWNTVFDSINGQFLPFAVDIIGHGNSDSPKETSYYTIPSIIGYLNEVLDTLHYSKVGIVGYSMGGRIALSHAISFPERVRGLVLESSMPGLRSVTEREERIKSDLELIRYIEKYGVDKFIDYWISQPLFNSQTNLPLSVKNLNKSRKRKNSGLGLINSLLSCGTGVMAPLWDSLESLDIPILLITGENDTKFTKINKEIHSLLPDSRLEIIKNAGHNVHLEQSETFTSAVLSFFNDITN